MKKLLGILAAIGFTASSGVTSVVACNLNYNDPLGRFDLETKNVKLVPDVPVLISIKNYDILVDEALPSVYTHDYGSKLDISINKSSKSLVFILVDSSDFEINDKLTVVIGQKQDKYTEKINLTVGEANATEFILEKNKATYQTNSINEITISNFDMLADQKYLPTIFEFDKDGYASAKLDISNKKIIIKTIGNAIDKLILTVKDSEGQNQKTISLKIDTRVIDLTAEYTTAILAGNMVDGEIDASIAMGNKEFVVTEESIISSFNTANKLNLTSADLDIELLTEGYFGIGDIYKISAKSGVQTVKGKIDVTLNEDIDPNTIINTWNLGTIKIYDTFLADYNEITADPENPVNLALIVFLLEYVGSKNKSIEYLKNVFLGWGMMQAVDMTSKSTVKSTSFTMHIPEFTQSNSKRNIFIANQELNFSFATKPEDRITFEEGIGDTTFYDEFTKEDLDAALKPGAELRDIQTTIWNKTSELFQSKVSLAEFQEFSKIKWANGATDKYHYMEILPGSNYLYGHDDPGGFTSGWIMFVNSLWSESVNDNLDFRKYKPDEKYITAIKRYDFFTEKN